LWSIIGPERRMKYAKAILGSVALFVLLDILISVMIPDRVMNVVFVVVASLVLLGILLVAFGTTTRNRWGINPESVNCPACGSPVPQVRRPKSLGQALWGGWTCEKCSCEMDKWGRLITRAR
jgi:hypothetical protein